MNKRTLSYIEIWNMSFGFLGIQMGFALQNANASRILQTFGADVYYLSWFWMIAPLMGLIVQPIIGFYSDRTWTKLGRRKPYILIGGLLASIGLVLMPQGNLFISILPPLWVGVGMLIVMNASFNITMEPFRALIGDTLGSHQQTLGFSIQTILIGLGAVIGSWLPYVLDNWFGLSTMTASGFPKSLIASFILGAIILIISVLITVFTTKEYSPNELASFYKDDLVSKPLKQNFGLQSIVTDFKNMPKTMEKTIRSSVFFLVWPIWHVGV